MSDKSKNSVWIAGLIYGSVLGAITVIVSVIFYVLGKTLSDAEKYVTLGITVVLLVYMLYMYRQEYLGGFAKYGELIGAGVIIAFVAGVISSIYLIILIKWIDPAIQTLMDDKAMEAMLKQFAKRGISPSSSEIDDIMEKSKMFRGPVFTSIAGIFGSAILGALISLVAGIFLKKENPDPFAEAESKAE
jgi:hypothetical protein